MDRNSLLGWTLMGVLMVAMMYFMNQKKENRLPVDPQTVQEDSRNDRPASTETTTTGGEGEAENLPEIEKAFVDGDDKEKRDSTWQKEAAIKYGAFANFLTGENEQIIIENDVLQIYFSSKGGRPDSVILKEYVTWDKQPLVVYSTANGELDINFSAYVEDDQTAGFHTKDLYFDIIEEEGNDGETIVSFRLNIGNGKYYEHEYIIPASGYMIDFNLNTKEFDDIIYSRKDFFELTIAQRYESLENNIQTERMYSSLSYADINYGTDKIGLRKGKEEKADYSLKWISFKQKFFSSVLIADKNFSAGSQLSVTIPEHKEHVKDASALLTVDYDGGSSFSFPMHFYFGPNKFKTLKSMDINLQKTMQLGASVIRWVNIGIIIPVFNFLNKFNLNYGIIILLLTLFIKLIVTPLTYKSYLSMIKMRVLQPELTELREKIGNDKQKMGTAQMDLYRKAGVNPLGGCLPMLFQFPILVAMYRFFPASIELRQESFLWAHDLSTFDSIYTWSQHIPLLSDFYGNHISLFTILMAITSFFYTRLNSMNTPTADPSNPMAQQMKMFQYVMPFMLLFIFNKFSAALSYYYFLFNLISVLQQFLMQRFLIDEDKIHAQIQQNKKKVKTKSKWQQRMEAMMAQQQKQKGKKR